MPVTPNQPLHLTGPALQFFETSCSLQPARQVNAVVSWTMARTPSQNVAFTGASHGDDRFEPAGRGIAVGMRDGLRSAGFAASDEDNWRDSGWSIDVTFPAFVIEVALAQTSEDQHWMAQVAPLKEPGAIAQLFGRAFISRETEVLAVSRALHRWLLGSGYQDVWWRIDGFPEPDHRSREPVGSGETAAS